MMRFFLLSLMASMLLTLSGCKDDPVEEDGVVDVSEEPGNSSWDGIKIQKSFCIVGSENIPFFNALSERCEKYVGIDEAELVFVLGKSVSANSDALLEAYKRGAIIAVVAPNLEELEGWCNDNNIPFVANVDDKLMLYAFNNVSKFYSLDTLPESFQTDGYSPMINSVVSWITKHQTAKATNDDDVKSKFTTQSITHAFNIRLEEEIAHVALSKPDVLKKYSTIDVSYNILPLHAFNVPPVSAEGDYYTVESEVTVHNSNMYNGKWTKKHGGVHARLCGYYMRSLKTTATLMTQKGTNVSNLAFPAGASPKPETTVNTTSYTNSLSWGLDATVSVGVDTKKVLSGTGTIGGGFEIGSSVTRNISDVNILKNSTNGVVEYTYEIQNLPKSASLTKDPPIPEVCKADFSMYASWVWYVPDAKDKSKDEYKINIGIVPIYGAYHWYSSAADYADYEFNAGNDSHTVCLIAPNRIPTGQLTLTNTSKTHQYVNDIKIWEKKNKNNQNPDYSLDGVIASSYMTSSGSGSEIIQVLPEGDYIIKYTCYNVDNYGSKKDEVKKQTSLTVKIADELVIDCGSGTVN